MELVLLKQLYLDTSLFQRVKIYCLDNWLSLEVIKLCSDSIN